MIIAFGLGVIVEYSLLNSHNTPEIELPKKPIPLAYRYTTQSSQNSFDTMIAEPATITPSTESTSPDTSKMFTASKTGTKYYPAGCSGINRIKTENRVYFTTEQEAQDQGYTRTSTCN